MGLLVALGFIRHLAMMTCNHLARPCAGGYALVCVKVNRSRCGAKKQHKIKCKIDSHLNELYGVCERP